MSSFFWATLSSASLLMCIAVRDSVAETHGTLFVDDDAPNDPCPGDALCSDPEENGSVDHPFDGIQEAIGAARDGDHIVLATGVYSGAKNTDLDYGGKGIMVRSTNPYDPAVVAATRIDCEGVTRAFTFQSGTSATSAVAGITIANGFSNDDGGAVLCEGSPRFINCVFESNHASRGGAVSCRNGAPIFVGCSFFANISDDAGGAIYVYRGAPTLHGCTFGKNFAERGAGILAEQTTMMLTDCVFTDNLATEQGGGIFSWPNSDLNLSGCRFIA